MRKVKTVPGWVQRPLSAVSGTEAFLLWVFGKTSSPEVLGSRASLAWIGGLNVTAPLSARAVGPTRAAAIAEFEIAHSVSAAHPYPTSEWWAERGITPTRDGLLSREWWEANSGYGYSCSYARGIAVAIGWAIGVIDDPGAMTPIYREDGTKLDRPERVDYARVLRKLSDLPPNGPPAPQPGRDGTAVAKPSS